jgi:hypothetical protein
MRQTVPETEWLSPAEAAAELFVQPATLANWRVQAKGPAYYKFGRAICIFEKIWRIGNENHAMSVKSRNGYLEYRFMYRGQNVFVSTGLADTHKIGSSSRRWRERTGRR